MSDTYTIAFVQMPKWQQEYIQEKLQTVEQIGEVAFFTETMDKVPVEELKKFAIISTFVQSFMPAELLAQLPDLKFIATRSTGFDHVDVVAAGEKNIPVSNVPSYGMNTVAEHAFALLLALAHKIPQAIERTKRGNFDRTDLMGFDLQGRVMGVIGTGKIGAHTVKIAHGFGMEIVAYDPYPNNELTREYGVEYMELEALLSKADVISLHVPYMPATHHIINQDNVKKIKKGAVLINTARGGLVENDALIYALEEGILRAAGLDVLEGEKDIEQEKDLYDQEIDRERMERLVENHVLLGMENVLVTQHNAFQTEEALKRILDTTIENIQNFISGNPQNVVKLKK